MDEKNEKKTPILELFKEHNYDVLKCPGCGSSCGLHHNRVEIFEREQDEFYGLHVIVADGKVTQDENLAGNPSDRRHGLSVHFWCECCDALPILHIAQHKGQTEVIMVVNPGKTV